MKISLSSTLLALVVAGGCGIEVDDPQKPDESVEEGLLLSVRDSELVAAQVDEAFSSVQGEENRAVSLVGDGAPTMALWAGGMAPLPLLDPRRSCEVLADGKVVGSYSDARSKQGEMRRRGHVFRVERSDAVSLEQTWSSPDVTLSCELERPSIPWLTAETLKVESRFTRKKVRKVDLPTVLASRMAKSKTDERDGKRVIALKRLADEGGARVFEKTISFQVAHKLILTTGQEHALQATLQTRDEAPLVERIEFLNGVVSRRVLKSGSQVSTDPDGTRVEMSFRDVVFALAGSCAPESGTIEGSFFAASTDTPRDTFRLVFAGGVGTITYASSGETDEYLDDCL